jgi:macrolide transport system ATP-binding/permease protein
MRFFDKTRLRVRSLLKRDRVESELTGELSFHLGQLIEEKIGQGVTPAEARYAALRELGGVDQMKEECRDMRRGSHIENFIQDVRYGAARDGFGAVPDLPRLLCLRWPSG